MGLLDDLKRLHLPPSHLPTVNEIQHLLGAVVAFAEHGKELLDAADKDADARDAGEPADHVDHLLSPPPPEPEPVAAPAGGADQAAEIAALQQQVETLLANQQRTEATVTPGEPPPEPPAAPGA